VFLQEAATSITTNAQIRSLAKSKKKQAAQIRSIAGSPACPQFTRLVDIFGVPCLEESLTPIASLKKNQRASPRAPGRGDRLGSGASSSPRPALLARARRTSGIQRQIGPLQFRPKFELAKKKRGRACTRRTYKKKETNYFIRFVSPSRCRVFPVSYISVLTCFSSVSLPQRHVTTVST
jgi:hypothetical protein